MFREENGLDGRWKGTDEMCIRKTFEVRMVAVVVGSFRVRMAAVVDDSVVAVGTIRVRRTDSVVAVVGAFLLDI